MKINCPHCGKLAVVLTIEAECDGDPKPSQLGYTIPQAAAALNLSESQVRRAVERGDINAIRFAGLRRIPQTELDRIRAHFEIRDAVT